jgi:uncharacterized membrane protein
MNSMSSNKEQVFQIRYNTVSTDDSNRWRLLRDGEEIQVSDIIINAETKTTKDYIEGVGEKWHVTCKGVLTIKDGVAHIDYKKPDNFVARHLAKTITWRIVGTIDTMILSGLITGDWKLGLAIGGTEVLTKMILYFFHERLWFKFGKLGR